MNVYLKNRLVTLVLKMFLFITVKNSSQYVLVYKQGLHLKAHYGKHQTFSEKPKAQQIDRLAPKL